MPDDSKLDDLKLDDNQLHEHKLDEGRLDGAALVERFRVHPRETFEEIVRLYQADVRVLARRHLGRTLAADEVAQQVFVAIYHGLDSYRSHGTLRAWIMGVAINQIRMHIRLKVKERDQLEIWPPELLEGSAVTLDADPFALENASADLQALRACLGRLMDKHRSVVEAFYFRGQSAESIATKLGQNSGAVRMLLLRIRQQLGKCIRKTLTWQGEGNE